MIYVPGATSKSIDVQIVDDTGLPVTGLVAATFPATYWSIAGNTAATQISLSDLALITTAYSSGGVKERTGSAGIYRLDIPDAALAATGDVRIYGEASGKHLICEGITVAYVPANTVQINGQLQTPGVNVAAKVNALPASPAAVGSAMTLTSAYDFAKGTVAMTESYNADGSAPTPAQALFVIMQALTEMDISGTTITIKKLDGSTTAFTLTLNSTSPTSVTRTG